MKYNLLFTLLTFPLIHSSLARAAAVLDETTSYYYQVPEGSRAEFTLDKVIPIQTTRLEIGTLNYGLTSPVVCFLSFSESNDLRLLRGTLSIDLSPSAPEERSDYTHTYTFGNHGATLNGNPVAIHFACADSCKGICIDQTPTLKDFRSIIESYSGQLILSKPIPFKN